MFSVIIPTLNNLDYLKICIRSLKKNSYYNHQILVHINVDLDGTRKYLESENIEYTYSNKNLGLCKAVNLASKKAKHNFIVYSHDDFYFCPNWDKNIYSEIIKIGHKKFYLSSTHVNTFGIESLNCGTDNKTFDEKKLLINCQNENFSDYQGSTWAPHIVHRDLWKKVNGFSEEFFPGAGSDPDFNLKLWNEGVRIFKTTGNSKVYHFESKTLRDKKKFKYFGNINIGSKSSKIFLRKWGISIKFFRKYYLKSGSLYKTELKNPTKNLSFILEFFFCKIKLFYLKIFNQ